MKTKIFNNIFTGDETWCFGYDPEAKRQSSEWGGETSPRTKDLKFQRSSIKTMLITFFDSQGAVHEEFVPKGQTANKEFYKGILERLLNRIQRVRSAAFCSRGFFLFHDNAPAHKAESVRQFFTTKNVTTLITSRTLQIHLRQTFSLPQVENEVKNTPLYGCC